MGQTLTILDGLQGAIDKQVLDTALRACSEGIALVEGGRIRYANEAFAHLLGFRDATQILGCSLTGFRPQGHPCARAQSDDGRPVPDTHLCQFVTQRAGNPLQLESTCSAFRTNGREFLIVVIRDVTVRERRRMVRDAGRRFRTIFDGAPMGIMQCDLEGRVLETNPAAQRMLGYSADELRGMHFRDFTHPEDVGNDLSLFQEVVEGKRESYELELRYQSKSAATGWVRLSVSLVRGVDGKPQFVIGMTEDITARKCAEQRLREAQKMEVVGRLVGGVAHDFNNLLTGITLYCDLLLNGLEPGNRLRHHAEEIRMAGEHGAALIQQLLATSRRQAVEPQILSLNDVVANTHNLLSRLLGDKFKLILHLQKSLGNVKIDPAQAQQILFNLVLNARDAMEAGGPIVIETANCEFAALDSVGATPAMPGVYLAVTDKGCGMTEETRARLFEPFFTTKANGRGTGLGLATVHDIVASNQGTVEVASELGKGSRFLVRLPRVQQVSKTPVEVQPSPSAGGETILLVEDNAPIREAAKRILNEGGYRVLEAGTGAEAMALSRKHGVAIDLLLTDVVMPGMSGRDLARQLRSDRPELHILHITGFETQDERSEDPQDPVVFFRKPFTGAALLEKVREILKTRPISPKKSPKGKREQS
jgi:two-component system cell cycle sensor histidine kinase/response regulator CckA